MDEKGQGAIEYLLMVAVALSVIAGIVTVTFEIFDSLGPEMESKIDGIRDNLIKDLK